jgi:tetratricopeptide (TPR) repeat protein
VKVRPWNALLFAPLLPLLIAAAPDPDAEVASLDQLVVRLASSDPQERDRAAKTLIAKGAEARPAVMRAMRSEDPELRAGAARVLLKLPWYLPDDSPNVRRLLEQYSQLDSLARIQVVGALSELSNHGYDALERLIVEEPDDQVKWAVARMVRYCFRDAVLEEFRQLVTPDGAEAIPGTASAPLLAAAGHAWFAKDMKRGAALLRAAIDMDSRQRANDMGELVAAYERVEHVLLLDGRYDEIAQLLRMRIERGLGADTDWRAEEEQNAAPVGVLDLFALHARFGPLTSFAQDLKDQARWLGDPRIAYCIARAYERGGNRALADVVAHAAKITTVAAPRTRFSIGAFLLHQGWHDWAEGEFAAVLSLSDSQPELTHANAHFRLSLVEQARNDDLLAATHLESAMKLHEAGRGQLRNTTEREQWQEVHWRYMKAAQKSGDNAEMYRRLDELMADAAALGNPDIVNDVVPLLKERARDKEAKELFDRTYQQFKQKIDTGVDMDHPRDKNNLAWLCARCGENKQEALALAKAASAAMPDNAAFMDTLAEAHFQVGEYDKAVEIEKKVVLLRPGDRFLDGQLRRFQDSAAGAKVK